MTARTADGASLFVLDDEALLFFEPSQELRIFNTAATFIWCCLEDGLGPAATVAAYAETFGALPHDAQRAVSDALHQWWGLGYLEDVEVAPSSPITFTTALARLLTNAELRAAFAADPPGTVRKLAVRPADVAAVAGLEPEALERQARLIELRHAALRHSLPTNGSRRRSVPAFDRDRTLLDVAAAARLRTLGAAARRRYYRLLTTHLEILYASPAQEAVVHPLVGHLEIERPAETHVTLELLDAGDGHLLFEDLFPVEYCRSSEMLAPVVNNALRRVAVERHAYFLEIHAGVVAIGERCVMLPGAPGRGKSTLTAALSSAGFDYCSDEFALLEGTPLVVRPFPLAMGIKPGSVDVLAPRYAALRTLPAHLRADGQRVRYFAPPSFRAGDRTLPVRWIVFPMYVAGAETRLRPLGKADALRRLIRESLLLPNLLDRPAVENFVAWFRGVECLELVMDSLADAVDQVRRLCTGDAIPSP